MKTIEISLTIHLPDGVELASPVVKTTEHPAEGIPDVDPVDRFWREIGPMAKELFRAAALIETTTGPGYTFEDIAFKMGVDHSSVLAFNRNAGRTSTWWERTTGTPPPIRLEELDYVYDDSGAKRMRVKLVPELAERILDLPYAEQVTDDDMTHKTDNELLNDDQTGDGVRP
jgi:hypothetical protein